MDKEEEQFNEVSPTTLMIMSQPPRMVHVILGSSLVLFVAIFIWSYFSHVQLIVTSSGLVRPLESPVGLSQSFSGQGIYAQIDGKIKSIHFKQGDHVKKGDVLIELDDQSIQDQIDSLKEIAAVEKEKLSNLKRIRQLKQVYWKTESEKLKAELNQVKSDLKRDKELREIEILKSKIELERTKQEENREKELAEKDAVAQVDLEIAITNRRQAEANLQQSMLPVNDDVVRVLEKKVMSFEKEMQSELGELDLRLTEQQIEIERSHQSLVQLHHDLKKTLLVAQVDGQIITPSELRIGDSVSTSNDGDALVYIVNTDQGLRLDTLISPTDIGLIEEGMTTRIKLDTYDYQKYGILTGKVIYISPDVSSNQDQFGYLVGVQLDQNAITYQGDQLSLKLGMTGVVEIVTTRERVLHLAFRNFRQSIAFN